MSLSLAGGTKSKAAAEAQQPTESTQKYRLLSSQSGHCARAWLQGSGKLPLLFFMSTCFALPCKQAPYSELAQ